MGLQNIVYYIGVISSLYLLCLLGQHLYIFLRPSSLPKYLHKRKSDDGKSPRGSWALVTGASDGIGLGFAQELCSHGFNVILHGRNRQKLLGIQEQLSREYPASKTKIVVFDAGEGDYDSLDGVIHEFGGRRDGCDVGDNEVNLTVLINNIGTMRGFPPEYRCYPDLNDYTPSQLDRVLNINARFAAHLTRLLLPTLIRNGPSLIMNISSTASLGIPYLSIYAASKGFIESFTKSLKTEMWARGTGVEVLGILVSNVKSGGNDAPLGFATPTSRQMARSALNRVGCGKTVVWGYWPHAMQMLALEVLHENVFQKVVIGAMNERIEKEEAEKKKE